MRRIEDERKYEIEAWDSEGDAGAGSSDLAEPCQEGTCGHYPELRIKKHKTSSATNVSQSTARGDSELFSLSENQLWDHLARPGGPADHFGHLLFLTRCTRLGLKMGNVEWTRLRNDLGGPHWLSFRNEDYRAMMREQDLPRSEDDIKDDEASVRTFSDESDQEHWDDRGEEESLETGTDRAEDLLQLAREVLASTTHVTNLSLSGFFHRALDAVQGPGHLHSLSLGPIPRWWQHVLFPLSPGTAIDGKTSCDSDSDSQAESEDSYAKERLCAISVDGNAKMPNLRRLRICGEMSSRDATKIATQMPSLRKVVWEMTNQQGFIDESVANVKALQGRQERSKATSAGVKNSKRYTEVRVGPQLVESLQREAPYMRGENPWRNNDPVEGTLHPVKVVGSPNVVQIEGSEYEDAAATAAAQYVDGKKWWEEGREGMGLHSVLEE